MSAPALWFDAEHTHAASGVFLLTPDGRVILQLRDDIPNIAHPGKITCFGGSAERHETPVACALRELDEETGIKAAPDALRFLHALSYIDFRGHPTACVFYVLEGVDPHSLVVTEGSAIVLSRRDIETDSRVTATCRQLANRITAVPY